MAGGGDVNQQTNLLPGIDRVMVTGASGFVGRALTARLRTLGKSVVEVSRGAGIDVARDQLPLEKVGHVFHAAGRTGVVESWKDPLGYLNTNVMGTASVLQQCAQHGCGVTYLSAYVYGTPERIPIRETDPLDVKNPYALSKLLGEELCLFYARACQLNVVALRLFNIYGAGQSDSFLVPYIVQQVIDAKRTTIDVQDLAPRRDYLHISDTVEGIIRAAQAPSGSVFNLGSGQANSVEEVIRAACRVAGVDKPYRAVGAPRRNEIDVTVADVNAIRSATGWCARMSLDDGLADVIRAQRMRGAI